MCRNKWNFIQMVDAILFLSQWLSILQWYISIYHQVKVLGWCQSLLCIPAYQYSTIYWPLLLLYRGKKEKLNQHQFFRFRLHLFITRLNSFGTSCYMNSDVFALLVQAPSTAPVMLSSGSDASPEASPTRAYPSKEEGKGGKQANLNSAGDRNDAAKIKGKTLTSTRRNITSVKGRTNLPFS